MGEIEAFAGRLEELGGRYSVAPLISYGNRLNGFVTVFDITNIEEQLQKFPEIISKLTHRREKVDG